MLKSMEDLADHNDVLLTRIPEQSHTTTIVRDGNPEGEQEGRSTRSDGHREKHEDREGPEHNQPEANDQDLHRDHDPEKACSQKEKKEKLRDVVSKLE